MGMCHKCSGLMKVVWGVLLLLNAFIWPRWLGVDGWVAYIAVLFVILGVVKWAMPNKCSSCMAMCSMPMTKKKMPAKRKAPAKRRKRR